MVEAKYFSNTNKLLNNIDQSLKLKELNTVHLRIKLKRLYNPFKNPRITVLNEALDTKLHRGIGQAIRDSPLATVWKLKEDFSKDVDPNYLP